MLYDYYTLYDKPVCYIYHVLYDVDILKMIHTLSRFII